MPEPLSPAIGLGMNVAETQKHGQRYARRICRAEVISSFNQCAELHAQLMLRRCHFVVVLFNRYAHFAMTDSISERMSWLLSTGLTGKYPPDARAMAHVAFFE